MIQQCLGDEGCLSQMTGLVEIELIVHYRGYVKDYLPAFLNFLTKIDKYMYFA